MFSRKSTVSFGTCLLDKLIGWNERMKRLRKSSILLIAFFSVSVCLNLYKNPSADLLMGQTKLFENTELSNDSSVLEKKDGESKILGYTPGSYRPGEATRVGLNFIPKEFKTFVYLSSSGIGVIKKKSDPPSISFSLRYLEKIAGTKLDKCQMIRGWLFQPDASLRFKSHPTLIVIKNPEEFNQKRARGRKKLAGGVTYYLSKDGIPFGFPKPDVMVIGTKNEVLNACRIGAGKGNDRQAGLEWIDYSKYDVLRINRFHPQNYGSAQYASSNKQGKIDLYATAELAKKACFRAELKNKLYRSKDVRKFLIENEELLVKNFVINRMDENHRDQYVKFVLALQKAKTDITTVNNEGTVLRTTYQSSKNNQFPTFTNLTYGFFPSDDARSGGRPNSSKNPLKRISANFERYQFGEKDADGSALESKLGRELIYNTSESDLNPLYINRNSNPGTTTVQTLLENTSSLYVRNRAINVLANRATASSLIALGLEAHRFDLSSAAVVPSSGFDDQPDVVKTENARSPTPEEYKRLKEIIDYYLVNPGDPVVLTAVCKIASDMNFYEHIPKLEKLSQLGLDNKPLNAALDQALSKLRGRSTKQKNKLKAPTNEINAISWLKGFNRAEKAGALIWVLKNADQLKKRSSVVKALSHLLDDGIFHKEATFVIKRIARPEDSIHFKKILQMAMNRKSPRSRMRQKFSLCRVAEVLFYLKDTDSLALAFSVGNPHLQEFLEKYPPTVDQQCIQTQVDAKELFVKEMTSIRSRKIIDRMKGIPKFTEDQRNRIREWAWKNRRLFKVEGEYRFPDFIDDIGPYSKSDVLLVMEFYFKRRGFQDETVEFLAKYGAPYEKEFLTKLKAKKGRWRPNGYVAILKNIGSQKSLLYLTDLLKNRDFDNTTEEFLKKAIQAIKSRI